MTTKRTTIRLGSPGELVQSVPYLLGFHPHESVVVLLFRQGRLTLTVRVDLEFDIE